MGKTKVQKNSADTEPETKGAAVGPETESAATLEAETPQPEPVKAKKGEPIVVRFRDHAGNPSERTFSLADHGEDYVKLAEQFRAKHASRLLP